MSFAAGIDQKKKVVNFVVRKSVNANMKETRQSLPWMFELNRVLSGTNETFHKRSIVRSLLTATERLKQEIENGFDVLLMPNDDRNLEASRDLRQNRR